jgi:hypothetical protein
MKRLLKKTALAVVSLLVCFLALEAVARVLKGVPLFYLRNFVETRVSLMKSVFPTQYDPGLGWVPKQGDHSKANYWGKSLTILDHGIRSNGAVFQGHAKPLILAVGDSFTYGSQVADGETWPARLEQAAGVRVLNGGVFAYGLDQTVLRAERLAEIYRPDLIIVSFIPDNVNRAERSVRTGVAKPYFDVVDGHLALRNTPVPPPAAGRVRLGAFRRIFGYSFLVDGLMRRRGLDAFWYLGDWENVHVHRKGPEVAELLMGRLAAFSREHGTKVVLLAQHQEDAREWESPLSEHVVAAARRNDIPALDLYEPLRKVADTDPARFHSFFRGHMTKEGNAFVAEQVAEFLKGKGIVPRPAHPKD